ncbi:cytochrome P450 71B36-like [Papaver somniferum]|uniref:cytochrome P450 71B36-like n=1 Tax=Papaver somniferum TaxID=3469 RepID=UPI000E705BBD|nr:cytochrome P450 71B36-like [Papaver somniferum]
MGNPIHQVLNKLSEIYGLVMLLQLGHVPKLVISSVEAAEQILKTFDLEFCTRPSLVGLKCISYNHLDIAFTPYGEYWREMRKICVLELFSTKRVQSFKAVRAEEIDVLIDYILSSSNATHVDVFDKFTSFTHRTICRFLLVARLVIIVGINWLMSGLRKFFMRSWPSRLVSLGRFLCQGGLDY